VVEASIQRRKSEQLTDANTAQMKMNTETYSRYIKKRTGRCHGTGYSRNVVELWIVPETNIITLSQKVLYGTVTLKLSDKLFSYFINDDFNRRACMFQNIC
jgi:hypothetical protein